ncbi:glycosyltransferase [Evansella clarkii]|uniref:glycosyltransferase n=1 Tax=Evansella clarkii TaxID=79879 RepID=UPI001F306AF7|nr:glycosyltransferase [Evansella clarkii]
MTDWFLYNLLTSKQKEYISGLFTENQKQLLKRLIKPGKKRTQVQKIERTKYRLYNLGFIDKGLEDLEGFYIQDEDPYLRTLAAWELALWHANQYSTEHAEKCLEFIKEAIKGEEDKDVLRRAVILTAESFKILGKKEEAKRVLSHALASKKHDDLYLALASLEELPADKAKWINYVYENHGNATVSFGQEQNNDISLYDQMETLTKEVNINKSDDLEATKVTVIIPVYNAEETINTALDSIITQTWINLEIIVVDDCSTDNTTDVIRGYTEKDNRITLLSTGKNSGAYTARNIALKKATGEYVTINDADDWSHPEKIETQVRHLQKHKNIIGNFSQQARATEDMVFYRRGKPGIYIFANMSSFMFRREPVMKKLGYWDSVRFAGDSEFVKRIKQTFGEKSVTEIDTAPLSFQRQSANSLTGDSAFGFPGYFMGARKEYAEAHEIHHANNESLYYPFPQEKRLFPVPEPMLPEREEKKNGRRHFDVIIASEFRLLGGTNMSNVEEIKAQKKLGLRTGLIQMSRYDLNSVTEVNPKVRELIDGDQVSMVVYGEKVSCDVLIVRHPPILQEWQKYIPDVQAKNVRVIVNQPPKREYSEGGGTLYEIERCVKHLKEYFGTTGIWHPIGPLIRETLHRHHSEELKSIQLDKEDWVNIINVQEWKRDKEPEKKSKIRIGRHSRDQYVKWPESKNELLAVYPDSEEYEICVLGGAKSPKEVLGELPSNWKVYEFGEIHPRDFLADIDVFVYYTHSEWVEAFGRVIFEAMAAGVPVIIPPGYKELFGDAAVYAEPHEVQIKVKELMSDHEAYKMQAEKAQLYVEQRFGYAKHASRLEECLK